MGEGPLRSVLEKKIAELDLGQHVRLCGVLPQEEVARRLGDCDVFVLACTVDGTGAYDILPTVILEAMAAGRPVVSTRLAAVPEMVAHGESGLLVRPGDGNELADALVTLARDASLREAFGRAGRKKAEATFGVEHTASQLKDEFQKHLKGSQPALAKTASNEATLLYLLDQWPQVAGSTLEAELAQARRIGTPVKIYACRPGSMLSLGSRLGATLFRDIEFLPEDVVLEAEWAEGSPTVAEIEGWRGELGPDLTRQIFLEQGQNALYLRRMMERWGVRHVHAGSSRALLCAWILKRMLGAITLSASLEDTLVLPATCVEALLSSCIGGRRGETTANLPPALKPPFVTVPVTAHLKQVRPLR